jgi:hypothetical protein
MKFLQVEVKTIILMDRRKKKKKRRMAKMKWMVLLTQMVNIRWKEEEWTMVMRTVLEEMKVT